MDVQKFAREASDETPQTQGLIKIPF